MKPAPDLRLAVGTLAAWAALLWGLSRSAGVVALAALVALCGAGLLAVLGRRWYRPALAAAAIALVLAPLAARLQADQGRPAGAAGGK